MGLVRNILISAAAMTVSSVASAQTRPNTSIPDDAQISSPRWNQSGNYDKTDNSSLAGVDQLVTTTVTAVPQARADAVVAKWTYRRLGHDLNLAANYLLRDFRESEEYDQAFGEFQDAYSAYEAARNKALAGMRDDERYQAALSIRKNVSEQIADEHDLQEPDRERLVSLAGLKVDTLTPFREQERDVLAADTNVVEARRNLIAAGKKLAKVERDFARQVRDNSTLVELRKSREDARIAMLASAAYLDESRTARDIALRYAYVARGYDRYVPRLYGDYGFGYYGGAYGRGLRYRGVGGLGGLGTPIVYPVITTSIAR